MVAVPAATPVTTPVEALTVATLALLLLHVPPVKKLDSVWLVPGQSNLVPITGPIPLSKDITLARLVTLPSAKATYILLVGLMAILLKLVLSAVNAAVPVVVHVVPL
jgi:hypothetical protein